MSDDDYMRMALSIARRGLGRTAPNPSVGCVIVKKNIIVGRGVTAEGGRPHAEAAALKEAGSQAKGATAYVTLEPCALPGREGPCAGALVKAGVRRVVIGCIDPNPQVFGQGIEILKAADIEVQVGLLEQECLEVTKGFILRMTESRPLVTLKIATTADNMIAPKPGEQGWITGSLALAHVHQVRSLHDAILVGIGTVLVDDPLLTTRIKGVTHKVPRIILDSHLRISLQSQLVRTANDVPVWIFHEDDLEQKAPQLEKHGVRLFKGTDVSAVLKTLAEEGITRLLVEGGNKVTRAFMEAGHCDQFLHYRSTKIKWLEGLPLYFDALDRKMGFKIKETRTLGEDLLEIYQPSA